MSAAFAVLSPSGHARAGREFAALATRHWQLLWELARRDVRDRFSGHALGAAWAIAHPLLLMVLYVGVFTYVFPARGLGQADQTQGLSVYILSGLIPWLAFQEVLVRSTSAIAGNASLVKQIVFPIEMLPAKTALGALPAQLVSTAFLLALAWWGGWLSASILLLPLVLFLQLLAMVGLAFLLAAIGAFFKDLREIVTVFAAANLFLQPILYSPAQLPPVLRALVVANPFSHLVWVHQDVVFYGRLAHPWSWGLLLIGAPLLATSGYRLFRTIKHRFGDVL